MGKEILVCLEGSPATVRATEVAIDLARSLPATLVGLTIIDEPHIRAGAATGTGGGASYKRSRDEALIADAEKVGKEWLAQFSARCQEANVSAITRQVRGAPAPSILAELENRDLAVMGQHVNFRHETDEKDNDTRDTVLHKAKKPVLLVPEGQIGMAEVALIAFDGSSAAKRAVQAYAASGLAQGRRTHIVTIDDDGAVAWDLANRGVQLLGELGIKAEPHHVVSTLTIAEAILAMRKKIGAGFLVMGAYAHSKLSRLLWGSVTHQLVEKTGVPLYLQH